MEQMQPARHLFLLLIPYFIDNFNENRSRRLGCYGETEKAQGRTYGFGTVLFSISGENRFSFEIVPKTKSKPSEAGSIWKGGAAQ